MGSLKGSSKEFESFLGLSHVMQTVEGLGV